MRKSILLGIPLTALFFSACSEELVDRQVVPDGATAIVASFEKSIPQARTSVNEEYKILWSSTDALGVYCADASAKFTNFDYASGAGTTTATFTGNLETGKTPSMVIYPYQQNMSVVDNTLTMELPKAFSYTADSNGPMYARVTNTDDLNNLSFTHMAALIKLTINKIPEGATTFVITASENIAGTCEATLTDEYPVLKVTTDASKTITVTFDASDEIKSREFYIPLPVNTYTSITAELTNGAGEKYFTKTLENRTLGRKNILVVPPLDCVTISGTTPSAINEALAANLPTIAPDQPVTTDVALTGDINTSNENNAAIEIPVVEKSNVNLAFTSVPTTTTSAPVILQSKETGTVSPTTSVNTVSVSVPAVVQSEAPSFTITMPATTVELGSVGGTATYNKVIATTATNTLIIKAGVTVNELEIAGGNVEVYGIVKKLSLSNGNAAETTVISYDAADIQEVTSSNYLHLTSVWDGVSKVAPTNNAIYTAAQLAYYQVETAPAPSTADNMNATIESSTTLYADIDLNKKPWSGMILGSGAVFDGGEHTISNIYITQHALTESSIYTPEACVGLFVSTKPNSQIKNVTIDGFSVDGAGADAKWSGALVGYSRGTILYENCHVKNVSIQSESYNAYRIGGLIGFIGAVPGGDLAVTLKNCSVIDVNLKGSYSIGGLVGSLQGGTRKFESCIVGGNVTLAINANSSALKGAYSGEIFYGPKAWAGYMSKFIGEANCSAIDIDNNCQVNSSAFTSEELTSFGYDDIAEYQYAKSATEAEKATAVSNANHYKLADGNIFLPACVDKGTIKVGDKTLVSGTDYNLFTLIQAGSDTAEGYNPPASKGEWAN